MEMKYLFPLFLVITFSSLSYAQENRNIESTFLKVQNYYILNLPYEIENNVEYVFDADTPLAIDIIKIQADDKILFFTEDIREINTRTYFNTNKTKKGEKYYFISMLWKPWYSGEVLRWNDGRGIIFSEIKPNIFKMTTNTYEISRGMNTLKITYRILLPYSSLSINELLNKNYVNNFSKLYNIVVDISKIFDQ